MTVIVFLLSGCVSRGSWFLAAEQKKCKRLPNPAKNIGAQEVSIWLEQLKMDAGLRIAAEHFFSLWRKIRQSRVEDYSKEKESLPTQRVVLRGISRRRVLIFSTEKRRLSETPARMSSRNIITAPA